LATSRQGDGIGRRGLLLAVASLAVVATRPRRAAAEDAAGFIQRIGDEVVAILGRPGVSLEARLDALVALLNSATDLELVSRLVLGKYWRAASDAQRAEYTGLFRALVIKAMADRLNQYGGETFDVVTSRAIDARDTLVSTRIFRPETRNQPTAVDWRVRAQDGHFTIIDIIAEGVSMVVTQRSEVASVVGQKGIDGLLQEMRQRLQQGQA
jgi:phospholipid transport system substrate-binding protein